MRGRNGRYLIGVFVFLCCTATAGHAVNKTKVLNATVFIDTNLSNGTGFYVGPNLIATSLHIISGAKHIRVLADGRDLDFYGVAAYDARQDLALLRVRVAGTPLPLSRRGSPLPFETIYFSAGLSSTDKRFKSEYTVRHKRQDFCHAGVKFSVIGEINSSGGPVLDARTEVRGVFFIGMFEKEEKLEELNYSFVVPVTFLRDLMKDAEVSVSVTTTPITVELDYCALISRANARFRKANRLGYSDIEGVRDLAKSDLNKGLNQFKKVRKIKIPVLKIITKLSKFL